ncbi:hypothetical protein WCE37_10790 [Luteimonas sp. MJ250]|uniref:hypothetical protein n=1 Tax=Luteimonas sp. MJ250 TaxID=3129236 RepID=UPI0031BAAEF8
MNWVFVLALVIGGMVLPRLHPVPQSREQIEATYGSTDVVGLEEKGVQRPFPWLPVLAALAVVTAMFVAMLPGRITAAGHRQRP